MEQDSARPKTLPSHVSVGTANLLRQEPMVAFQRWARQISVARPGNACHLAADLPFRIKGEVGPLQLRGAGRGFPFPSSFT